MVGVVVNVACDGRQRGTGFGRCLVGCGERDKRAEGGRSLRLHMLWRQTGWEPRNFNRSFDRCIRAARAPRITVHGTRKTCASLLAALDVPPAWRCASCGTARSTSRWRSTPRHPRKPPATRCASSATCSHDPARMTRCCTLLLHQDQKGPVPSSGLAFDLRWS